MTMALEGGEGSASRPGCSLPLGKTWYPLYRRLGGPRGQSGQVQKISPPPGFDPRTVQPVASRYTDYATWPTPNRLQQPYWLAPRYWELINGYTLPYINSIFGQSAFFLDSWPLKMGPICCPKTSVRNYRYSLHNNTDKHSSHSLKHLLLGKTSSHRSYSATFFLLMNAFVTYNGTQSHAPRHNSWSDECRLFCTQYRGFTDTRDWALRIWGKYDLHFLLHSIFVIFQYLWLVTSNF
jgi:hypothetical protein